MEVGQADDRVLHEPAPVVFVDSFGTDTVTLQIRLWVMTPNYRSTLRDLTEQVKLAINRMLAAGGDGATAEIKEADDPHVAHLSAPGPT